MSSRNRFEFSGLEELKAQLRQLPSDLSGEAAHLVESATNAAAVAIKAGYAGHRRSGDLQDHVEAETTRTPFGAAGQVKNTSKLASIFENGSQARHTSVGANRGAMPAAHVFVPVMVRERRRLYDQIRELLIRAGLVVSGDE